MKNYLRVLVPFVVLGLLAILFFKIKDRLNEKRKIQTATAMLPNVSFLSIEGDSVSINAPTNKVKYLVFFNSECEHCQSEARLLADNFEAFEDAGVYFLSNEPLENIINFREQYLKGQVGFKIGSIDSKVSSGIFGVHTFPYLMIYGSDNKLLKTFKGEVKLEALTQYVKQ
jgi:thiol-disulfide isomerase/thioredoxin